MNRLAFFLGISLSLPTVVVGQEQVYFGNLHSHTSYSDGSGTPAQAYALARDSAHLDFLAITEHNHLQAEGPGDRRDTLLIARNPTLYKGPQAAALIPTANRLNRDGQFVTLYGQEFSTIAGGNHVNLFDVKEVVNVASGRFDLLIDWLQAHPDSLGRPIIMQLNHPSLFDDTTKEYGADDFPSIAAWVTALAPHAALIEVLNGPALERMVGRRSAEVMNADFLAYLNRGFRVAPTGDQDNHYRTWGAITESRTGVIAPALTRQAILEALRERHVYATEDRNLELIGRVNDHLMGSIIPPPVPGSVLDITLSIHDRDEPGASYRVEVITDSAPGGPLAQVAEVYPIVGNNPPNLPYVLDGIRFQGPGEYLFIRVRQIGEDGLDDRAWTAPVWFDSGAAVPIPASPPVRIISLVPNATGDERQTEEITLKNTGSSTLNLSGWTVRDLTGKTWSLAAVTALAPGAERTVRRSNQPMSLNNGGDTIQLLDAAGVLVQSVTYPAMADGQRFDPPQP
jgi:hypothetical protein